MPQTQSRNIDALWVESFRRALIKKTSEPEGTGWLTSKEFRGKTGLGKSRAELFLRVEVREGRMERFLGSMEGKNGTICPQIWYRPKA